MTKRQFRIITKYILYLQKVLRLRDWTVSISEENCEKVFAATMKCTYGRKQAMLWLNEDFFELSEEEQTHTLLHELIHIHFWEAQEIIRVRAHEVFSTQKHYEFVYELHKNEIEFGVDAMADVMLPLVTPISWEKVCRN